MNQVMASSRVLFVAFVLIALASRSSGQGKDEMQYEAKLLHKLPLETYTFPVMKDTKDGLTLLVVSRAGLNALEFEAISFWNVPGNKEAHRVLNPRMGNGVRLWNSVDEPWMTGAMAPDGKKLAMRHKGVTNDAQSACNVELYDFATGKTTSLAPRYVGRPQLLFLPNDDLVVVNDALVLIQKIGDAKPRLAFKVPSGKFDPGYPWKNTAEVSPDGSRLAVCQRGIVSVFDTKTGKAILQLARGVPASKASNLATNSLFTSMAFVGAKDEPALLTLDHEATATKDILVARVIDLKTKKEFSKQTLVEKPAQVTENPFTKMRARQFFWGEWTREGSPFADAKLQPRVLFGGKIYNPTDGKVLGEFDPGRGARLSRDGQYIVRLTDFPGDNQKNGVEIWSFNAPK